MLICYKLSKANFVLNALLQLLTTKDFKLKFDAILDAKTNIILNTLLKEKGELNALFAYNAFIDKIAYKDVYKDFSKHYAFIATFIKITFNFKEKFIKGYKFNLR